MEGERFIKITIHDEPMSDFYEHTIEFHGVIASDMGNAIKSLATALHDRGADGIIRKAMLDVYFRDLDKKEGSI